jgi:hypothetical protein
LDRSGGDLFGGLMKAGVDDFHPGIAQGARDYLYPSIVSIKTRLGDQDPGTSSHDNSSFACC